MPANPTSRVYCRSSNFSQCRLQHLSRFVGFAEDICVRAFGVQIPPLLVQHVEERASTKVVRLSDGREILPGERDRIRTVGLERAARVVVSGSRGRDLAPRQ